MKNRTYNSSSSR